MKAALFPGLRQPLTIEEVRIANPAPREVLISTRALGLCHSDLHHIDGHSPLSGPAILGPAAAGVIEKVGRDVTGQALGDHVISCLSVFCGHCDHCVTGRP